MESIHIAQDCPNNSGGGNKLQTKKGLGNIVKYTYVNIQTN